MATKSDKIKDWYKKVEGEGLSRAPKLDKNFKTHLIKPCMMIGIVGSTGSGKTTAIVEFLSRKNNSFCQIILFSGSTVDEPLVNMLKSHIEGIELIDKAEELPDLTDFNDDDDKMSEKLVIFDDIINLPKKEMTKIQKWFNSARKYGFTCIATAQNYPDLGIQIRRNIMVWLLFRLNDINTINSILKNHNTDGTDKDIVKAMYIDATKERGDFFKLDLTVTGRGRYSHNFTDLYQP